MEDVKASFNDKGGAQSAITNIKKITKQNTINKSQSIHLKNRFFWAANVRMLGVGEK